MRKIKSTRMGVACLKINVRNYGDVVNAFDKHIAKREHLQIE